MQAVGLVGRGMTSLSSKVCRNVALPTSAGRFHNRKVSTTHNLNPLDVTVRVSSVYREAFGSGFCYDDKGHLVTSAHLLPDGGSWYQCYNLVGSINHDETYIIKGFDKALDVAVLKPIYGAAKPEGSVQSFERPELQPSLSCKTLDISGYDHDVEELTTLRQRCRKITLSTDKFVFSLFSRIGKPGLSGSLVTSKHGFEGMLVAVMGRTFADVIIPAKVVDFAAQSLIENGYVVHFQTNITVSEEADELLVKSSKNPALKENDKILAVNGVEVTSITKLAETLSTTEVRPVSEKNIVVLLCREGEVMEITVPVSRQNYHQPFSHGRF